MTKFKTAKAIEAAAKNEGGTAGAGMGMGMGFVLAQQMGNMMSPQMGGQQQLPQQQNQASAMPPPVPQATSYFYALNGAQTGPVPYEQLRSLFASRTVNKDTLVWKAGMDGWKALSEVEELKGFLGGNTPPPLP